MKASHIVIGGGGHARALVDILLVNKLPIKGYTDHSETLGNVFQCIPYMGNDETIFSMSVHEIQLVNGIGSITQREKIFTLFKEKRYTFATVQHPSAIVSPFSTLEEGVQVMAGAIIQPGCFIGKNSIINTRASVDHDCVIGNHVHISPGAVLCGSVVVEDNVQIGAGATVIQGVRIGKNSLVGAGAVVIRDVPEGTTVIGVPAKEVRK